jgi:methyl-accepting chemotaxis protein
MMSINRLVSNFTKLVSDIQKLTSNGNTAMHTLAFFGKIVECVEKINSAIAYANESSVDVTNKIIDVINDATQKTVNILNECIKIVNKSIQTANKVGDFKEDVLSNVKIEDYQLKKLDKPKTQAEIVPPKELLKNDIENNVSEYRSEYQELNNARDNIAEEFQSSLKSFDDIAKKLEDIYTSIERIRVNMEDINGELVDEDPKYNIKKIRADIASVIALTAARKSNATSTNISD